MTIKKPELTNHSDTSFLAREIGTQMLARLEFMTLKPKTIANLGNEAGCCEELLKNRYSEAEIIMLDEADILNLPNLSVDLIFANLALPWSHDFKNGIQEWRRILRPEGLLMFSSLGPDTLMDLHEGIAKNRVPKLNDMHDLGDALVHARFADPVLDVDYLTVTYRHMDTLLDEMQAMRMIEVNDQAEKERVIKESKPNSEGVFPLTFEIVYGHAWGVAESEGQLMDEEGVVKIPLSHVKKTIR